MTEFQEFMLMVCFVQALSVIALGWLKMIFDIVDWIKGLIRKIKEAKAGE